MPRKCSCCTHKEASKINRQLANGATLHEISAAYGMHFQAVRNHKIKCIPNQLSAALKKRGERAGEYFLGRLDKIIDATESLYLRSSEEDEDGKINDEQALRTLTEMRKQLESFGKYFKLIDDSPKVNVNINAQIEEIKAVFIDVLSEYPGAKEKLIERLNEKVIGE